MKQAELFNVKDHVAFVTGAASGLGLAYAEVMAENGARVVLADINQVELDRHAGRLRAAGCTVEPVVVDVADTAALRAAIDAAAQRHRRLDVLFANAGISAGQGPLTNPAGAIDQFDVEAFKRAIDINMTATLMAMRFAVPHMKQRRSGASSPPLRSPVFAPNRSPGMATSHPRLPSSISCVRPRWSSRRTTFASTPSRRDRFTPISAVADCAANRRSRNCLPTWFRSAGWRKPTKSKVSRCCWRRRRAVISPVPSFRSTAAPPR